MATKAIYSGNAGTSVPTSRIGTSGCVVPIANVNKITNWITRTSGILSQLSSTKNKVVAIDRINILISEIHNTSL